MAEPSTDLTTQEAGALPAVLGNYRIASMAPAKLAEIVSANIAGGISAFDLDRIKVPSGGGIQWAVPGLNGETYDKVVEGVIVAWSDQRAYWKESFSGAGTPPDCASRDSRTGVGDPGGSCLKCPFAQFGSAVKDGKAGAGQACKQVRLLFLVRPSDMLPIVISVPPTSLKNLKSYFLRLAGAGVPYYSAVTRFTLSEDKNATGIKYSKVEPTLVAPLGDEEAARVKGYSDSIRGVLQTIDATAGDFDTA